MAEDIPLMGEIDVFEKGILDIGDIPVLESKPIVKKDELFYAVATESFDPINDWKKANEEASRTGQSTLYNLAQEKWIKEQNDTAKEVITGLMLDITVPQHQKISTINAYLAGNYISSSMRDKYIVKQASFDSGKTEEDRRVQDSLADSVHQRDRLAQEEEAKRLIEQADVDFSAILKGTGAVASQIALSIPAGYAALYGLLKEQDPEKAKELLRTVQEWGYAPDDAASQKVMQKFQSFMEFIDIPFKWLGDKTLDFTGSPGAATAAYTASSMIGYYGAYKGAKAGTKAIVKGVRKDSPAGTTATANKPNASEMGAAAVADSTGQVASAMGTTREAIISDWVLPKISDDLADRPDLLATLEKQDKIMSGLFEEVRVDPNIYPVSKIAEDKQAYLAIMTETTGPRLLTSRSVLDFEWTEASSYLKGKALFGRNEHYGYDTQMAAEYAAEQLKASTARLPEVGDISVTQRGDQYFVQWEFKRQYDPLDKLVFGEDALKATVVGIGRDGWKPVLKEYDVTRFANSMIGEYIWPAFMRMKTWVPSIGAQAGWKQARIEQAFLSAQKDLVHKTKHNVELDFLLKEGEKLGKEFKLEDTRNYYPHLTTKEVQDLHASYLGYRRIEDYLYNMSDRKFRYLLEKDDYQALYTPTGDRVGFASSKIPTDEPIKKVWDFTKQAVVERDKDIPIIKLHDAVRVGDNLYNYANIGSMKMGPIQPGSLNKIPGYITRQYKEWFVVEKQPKKLEVDGNKIGESELRNYRQAVAMGKTRKEAELLRARFEQEDPNHTYLSRAERKDVEDKIIFDSKIYDAYFSEHQKRGGKLPGLNRETEVEDVLVAQTKAIMTTSRLEAFGPYMEHARKQFVKEYGEFTRGQFPNQISDIQPGALKGRMTAAEEARFKAAQQIYKQLELQQFSDLPSDAIWKGFLGAIADAFEHSFLAKLAPGLREVGQMGMLPVKYAKSLGTHMWLFMRPQRMWIVQPQQLLELSTINPTFAKIAMEEAGIIWAGLVTKGSILRKLNPGFRTVGKRGMQDYDEVISALERTGIMQAVDTNQMVHGWWKDAMEELVPSATTKALQTAKKTVLAPSKVMRSVGYDASELMNQVLLWLFSRHKWMAENPGKNWNTPENIAEIGQLTWRIGHGASTRAGMMPMQEGVLSALAQFIAIPHKSFMQQISSPDLTPQMKAKLFGARLFWYGKWGVPGGAALYSIMQQYLPEEEQVTLDKFTRGASDYIMNETMSFVTGQKTDSYWSKSTSTVTESLYIYDAIHAMVDMAAGNTENAPKFPFMNATTSIYKTVNTLWDMYNIPTLTGTEPDWAKIAWKAASFTGTLNDIDKALIAHQLTKTGQKLGHIQTTGEIINRLFGVPTAYENLIWEMVRTKGKREKYIDNKAKEIHDRMMILRTVGAVEFDQYWQGVKAFMASIPKEYKDNIILGIKKWDRYSQETMGDSMALYILNNYKKENDGYMQQLRNLLANTDDPRLKQVNEVLK